MSTGLQDLASAKLANLRSVATPDVVSAKAVGEDAFPAVVVERTAARVRVYDTYAELETIGQVSSLGGRRAALTSSSRMVSFFA